MALKIGEKFEGKLTCASKIDKKNLENFHRSTRKFKNWDFDEILLYKIENVSAQNFQGSYVLWQWRMMQNLKRNWLVVSKLAWGIWRILTRALENLKHFYFNGLLNWPKYRAKKVQMSYVWWHWVLILNLKENWLVLSKMTWRIFTGWKTAISF